MDAIAEMYARWAAGDHGDDESWTRDRRAGRPPTYVQAGGAETGLGDAELLTDLAREAGVEVRLDVLPGRLHSFQMAAGNEPGADDAIGRFAGWVRPKLAL